MIQNKRTARKSGQNMSLFSCAKARRLRLSDGSYPKEYENKDNIPCYLDETELTPAVRNLFAKWDGFQRQQLEEEKPFPFEIVDFYCFLEDKKTAVYGIQNTNMVLLQVWRDNYWISRTIFNAINKMYHAKYFVTMIMLTMMIEMCTGLEELHRRKLAILDLNTMNIGVDNDTQWFFNVDDQGTPFVPSVAFLNTETFLPYGSECVFDGSDSGEEVWPPEAVVGARIVNPEGFDVFCLGNVFRRIVGHTPSKNPEFDAILRDMMMNMPEERPSFAEVRSRLTQCARNLIPDSADLFEIVNETDEVPSDYMKEFPQNCEAFQNLRVEKLLGEGGFGRLELVTDEKGDQLALKTIQIRPQDRFSSQKEVYMLMKTRSQGFGSRQCLPHNICLLGWCMDDEAETLKLLMPLVKGSDMIDWLNSFPKIRQLRRMALDYAQELKISDAEGFRLLARKATLIMLDIMKQIAEGVRQLHEHDLIHLDLKPENIMISGGSPEFIIKKSDVTKGDPFYITLVDLGLSCIDNYKVSKVFQCLRRGGGGGTAKYVAPERLDETLAYDMKPTDIFSLGVVFYEIARFETLFDEKEGYYHTIYDYGHPEKDESYLADRMGFPVNSKMYNERRQSELSQFENEFMRAEDREAVQDRIEDRGENLRDVRDRLKRFVVPTDYPRQEHMDKFVKLFDKPTGLPKLDLLIQRMIDPRPDARPKAIEVVEEILSIQRSYESHPNSKYALFKFQGLMQLGSRGQASEDVPMKETLENIEEERSSQLSLPTDDERKVSSSSSYLRQDNPSPVSKFSRRVRGRPAVIDLPEIDEEKTPYLERRTRTAQPPFLRKPNSADVKEWIRR